MTTNLLTILITLTLLSGCTGSKELKPTEITQLVHTCTPTEEEQRLIRQSVIEMGMQSCVVIKIMGTPERITKGEKDGLMIGDMLYKFESGDFKERVLIKLSMDRVLSISVARLRLFGSSFFSPTMYAYDPAKQIPYK